MRDSRDLTERITVDGKEISSGLATLFGNPPEQTESVGKVKAETDLKYFHDLTDFIMMLLLVGIRHAIPGASNDDAVKVANALAKRIHLPAHASYWTKMRNYVDRHGMSSAVNRLIQELQREKLGGIR